MGESDFKMSEDDALEIIREKYSEYEFYYAEHDRYPKGIDSDFVVALETIISEYLKRLK